MRWHLICAGGLLMAAGPAIGGAIERTTQSVDILFAEGRYVELSFGRMEPNVSGRFAPAPGVEVGTGGSVLSGFNSASVGFKMPVTPEFDLALVIDQPVGADVFYPAGTGYPIAGTTASVDLTAVTLMGRYRLPSDFSVIGGVRMLRTSGDVNLPVATPFGVVPYRMSTSTETDWGYLVGVAYERPDIGLRVALTYNSAIDHRFAAHETTALGVFDTEFTTTIPQSVHLEAQTGIAEDTLLFGSIRWVDWSAFDIDPVAYRTENPANPDGEKLVGYEKDFTTYTLGLGRRFTDNWAGAVTVAYEDKAQELTSNLGPTNGYWAYGLALTYEEGPFKVTGAVRYYDFTTTDTQRLHATFASNHGWAAGVRIGYSF